MFSALTAPGDYQSITGMSLTFAPGVTEMIVSVDTVLDEATEGAEQFLGVLSSPTAGASITVGRGTATVDLMGTSG